MMIANTSPRENYPEFLSVLHKSFPSSVQPLTRPNIVTTNVQFCLTRRYPRTSLPVAYHGSAAKHRLLGEIVLLQFGMLLTEHCFHDRRKSAVRMRLGHHDGSSYVSGKVCWRRLDMNHNRPHRFRQYVSVLTNILY